MRNVIAAIILLASFSLGFGQEIKQVVKLEVGTQVLGVIDNTDPLKPTVRFPDLRLLGPDWATEVQNLTLELEQGERRFSWVASGSYSSPVRDLKGRKVTFNFDLFDKNNKRLGVVTTGLKRDCYASPRAFRDPIKYVNWSSANYRLFEVKKVVLNAAIPQEVIWCKWAEKRKSKNKQAIIIDPSDSYFDFQTSNSGFYLTVSASSGVKYSFPNPSFSNANGLISIMPNVNPDLLDILYRPRESSGSTVIQNIGAGQQLEVKLPWGNPQVCVEPGKASNHALTNSFYRLRGFYVPKDESNIKWFAHSIRPPGMLVYEEVTSVSVYDPPTNASNRLIFYFVCAYEPTLGFNRLANVLATPPNVAQPFKGFEFISAKGN